MILEKNRKQAKTSRKRLSSNPGGGQIPKKSVIQNGCDKKQL